MGSDNPKCSCGSPARFILYNRANEHEGKAPIVACGKHLVQLVLWHQSVIVEVL